MQSFARRFVITAGSAMLLSARAWAQSPFIGKWGGSRGGVNDSTLELITVTEAGVARGVYTFRDTSSKFIAKIENGKLSWGDPVNGVGFEFTLLPDGRLHGERYDHGSQAGDVTMTKV